MLLFASFPGLPLPLLPLLLLYNTVMYEAGRNEDMQREIFFSFLPPKYEKRQGSGEEGQQGYAFICMSQDKNIYEY